mgnify:CR=1 FL=1
MRRSLLRLWIVVGGIAWIRVERRSSTAVFDVALMKAPLVTASCICIALFAAARFGIPGTLAVLAGLLLVTEGRELLPTLFETTSAFGTVGLSMSEAGAPVSLVAHFSAGGKALVIAMMPLWFALLGWIYLRERLPRIVNHWPSLVDQGHAPAAVAIGA